MWYFLCVLVGFFLGFLVMALANAASHRPKPKPETGGSDESS